MRKVKISMCDLGFGANSLGIQHGYTIIKERYPDFANQINYLSFSLFYEDSTLINKKYYNTIYNNCFKVYQEMKKLHQENVLPILIGGDHSLALASVKATLEKYQNEEIGLVWIDAHTDINTFETTETGNIHGMPVASLLGVNDEKYNSLGNNLVIKPDNIVYLGTRDIDVEEEKIIEDLGILNIRDSLIKETGLLQQVSNAIEYLKPKVSKIHISFDLDSINPDIIKGVSTPVRNGLDLNEPFEIIKALNDKFEIVSLDIVEYNPIRDTDGRTLEYLYGVVKKIENMAR